MANERGPKYDFSVVSTSGADETTLTEVDSSLLSFGTTPRYPGKGKRPYPSSKGARSTGGKSTFLSTPVSRSGMGRSTHSAGHASTPRGGLRSGSGASSTAGRRGLSSAVHTPGSLQTAVIVALVEGRGQAKGEIGMASIDLKRPELLLSQFPDSQTYVRVITKLAMLQPLEVIMPNTACDGANATRLYKLIGDQFPTSNLVTVQRRYFNETKGLQYIKQLCVPEFNSVEMEVGTKMFDDIYMIVYQFWLQKTRHLKMTCPSAAKSLYYCLATAAALLKYVEFIQNLVYAPRSLKIVFKGCEQTTMIDATTVKNLELISNAHSPSSGHSLFGVLSHTKTSMGTRLLRANILQPPYDLGTVNMRLDCVAELTEQEETFWNLQAVVARFLDVDHLISACIQIPKQETVKLAENRITYVIQLKHVLELLEPLRAALGEGMNPLLKACRETLSDPRFKLISEKVQAVIHDDTRYQKGTLNMRTQKCFAVKPKINGLLDVARRTYTETVDDIAGLVQQLSERYRLPLKTSYNTARGFFIQLYAGACEGGGAGHTSLENLPSEFIKLSKQKNNLSFVTADLIRLNDRIRESLNEIYLMTNVVITQLLDEIREMVGCLHKLSECVAVLDMLLSFAHVCTVSPNYVRPEFTDTLAVQQGRHPILSRIMNDPVVPNNAYASRELNFVVITGPNMAGKSTYLKQLALIQVMAQIGSFVPAEYASLRLADQIFSRIGSDDDIETNSSTFMLEMKEINYIVQNVSANSLVIIDELGRGTSSEEGVGICFAICEHLLHTKAFTFFATHALELTNLDALYPNVENYHFEVKHALASSDHCKQISYTHVLTKGRMEERSYGIQLAAASTMPRSIVEEAKEILQQLQIKEKDTAATDAQMQHQRSIFQLATHLVQLARNSRLDQASMVRYMQFLKEKYAGLQGGTKGVASKEPASHTLPPQGISVVGSDILAPED